MRDSLEFLFRQRFKGHEAPVDPGVWEGVQGQLAAGAPAPDQASMEDVFRERFQGHEMDVDPGVWSQIGSQLGHGVATGTVGTGANILGWAAAGIGVLALVGGVYVFSPDATDWTVAEIRTEARIEPSAQQPTSVVGEAAIEPRFEEKAPVNSAAPSVVAATATPAQYGAHVPDADRTDEESTPKNATQRVSGNVETIVPHEIEPTAGEAFVQRIITDLTEQVKEEVMSRSSGSETAPPAAGSEPREEVTDVTERAVPREPSLFLQNTFTPNGDGVNDTYTVSTEGFERMIIKVFSVKNNQLVFSTNTNEPWTGDNCEDGYYLLAVEAMTYEGRLVTKGQVVWLNRTPQN